MPAKDIFHDCVKHALIKDGWIVTDDPLSLKIGKKDLFIDLAEELLTQIDPPSPQKKNLPMSNPIIIETDLKDILAKLDNRLERIETKLEVLPKIEAEVSQLKEDVKDLKERATAQIWALIVTVIGATVAAIIKFGFLTKT